MPPRSARLPLLLASSLLTATAAAAPVTLHLSGEAGPELDTNATRLSQPSEADPTNPVMAPLLRVIASGGLRARLRGHLLALDYGGGGKLFVTEDSRRADEMVHHASAGWGVSIGEQALWLSGSYYDAFQRFSTRDFRTGAANLQIAIHRLAAGLRAGFDIGYRGLGYKPLREYSFHGLTGGVGLTWHRTSGAEENNPVDWELRGGYTAGLRFFEGAIIALPETCTGTGQPFPCTEEGGRRDLHHQLRIEASYAGNATAGLAYTLEVNRSNSYGETFIRHAVGLRFTAGLIWGLFMTAKATLQLSSFEDPFLVSQVSELSLATIDDENRSSLVVQISREIDEHWAINLRWSLYVNESSVAGDASSAQLLVSSGFLRHTVFLGVRFEYGK